MIIAFINQKGGVGKTTSAVNIGAGLARLGRKVMLVDLDPQAHLTYSLGIQSHELPKTLYHALRGEMRIEDILVEREGVDVAPSSLDLSGAEIELASEAGREFILREALAPVYEKYNYIILDCPPSLGLISLNALTAADSVYIPLQAEFLALQGVSKLLETVDKVRHRLNPGLEIGGVIATRYDGRKGLNREVVERIREHFGDKVFNTLIRDNVAIAEAPSFGQSIFVYKQKSNGSEDYASLCREIRKREKRP